MFINLSNHQIKDWSQAQLAEAGKWGQIVEYPFPSVPASASKDEINEIADAVFHKVAAMKPEAVMCQGEFTLTYALVSRFLKHGICVLAACSERRTTEKIMDNGTSCKYSEFVFGGFREYRE